MMKWITTSGALLIAASMIALVAGSAEAQSTYYGTYGWNGSNTYSNYSNYSGYSGNYGYDWNNGWGWNTGYGWDGDWDDDYGSGYGYYPWWDSYSYNPYDYYGYGGYGYGSQCGEFIQNAATCPAGYHCQLNASRPDTGGTCVPNGY